MKINLKLVFSTFLVAVSIGCQAAPPFIGRNPNLLIWTVTDTNAVATNIKAYDGTNWNTVATVGVPTNSLPLAGLPYAVLCATSIEPDAESAGSNQVTNSPPVLSPSGLVKK